MERNRPVLLIDGILCCIAGYYVGTERTPGKDVQEEPAVHDQPGRRDRVRTSADGPCISSFLKGLGCFGMHIVRLNMKFLNIRHRPISPTLRHRPPGIVKAGNIAQGVFAQVMHERPRVQIRFVSIKSFRVVDDCEPVAPVALAYYVV